MPVESISSSNDPNVASAVLEEGVLSESKRDQQAEEQIKECFASGEFTNKVISYNYNFRNWGLRIVNNPKQMVCTFEKMPGYQTKFRYALLTKEMIPMELQRHVEQLIKRELKIEEGGYIGIATTISMRGNSSSVFDLFAEPTFAESQGEEARSKRVMRTPTLTPDIIKKLEADTGVDLRGMKLSLSGPAFEPTSKPAYDKEKDEEILALLSSEGFANKTFNYTFQGKSYPVTVVHNPKKLPLWDEKDSSVFYYPLMIACFESTSDDADLTKHLEKLARQKYNNGYIVKVGKSGRFGGSGLHEGGLFRASIYDEKLYERLHVVQVNKDGALNKEFNALIKEVFSSKELRNATLHYQIKDKYYQVHLLHNPEKLKPELLLASSKTENRKTPVLGSPYKYEVVIGRLAAPKELVDHITSLINPSWWDYFFNLRISNGTTSR